MEKIKLYEAIIGNESKNELLFFISVLLLLLFIIYNTHVTGCQNYTIDI